MQSCATFVLNFGQWGVPIPAGLLFRTFRSSRIVTRVIFQEMKSDHGSAADEVDDDDGEDCDDVDGGNA